MTQRLEKEATASTERQKFYPEIPLEEVLANQRQIIIERLVRPLGINERDALAQLSFVFPARKPPYDGFRLTVPLVVPQFRGVSWLDAVDAAGFLVSDYLREQIQNGQVHPWNGPGGIEAPTDPHGIWLQDGTMFINRRPIDVRKDLQSKQNEDLHTGNLWRGLALALLRFDMVKNEGWDLIGESVGSARVPYLYGWVGGPEFLAVWVDDAYPLSRAFVCGS